MLIQFRHHMPTLSTMINGYWHTIDIPEPLHLVMPTHEMPQQTNPSRALENSRSYLSTAGWSGVVSTVERAVELVAGAVELVVSLRADALVRNLRNSSFYDSFHDVLVTNASTFGSEWLML